MKIKKSEIPLSSYMGSYNKFNDAAKLCDKMGKYVKSAVSSLEDASSKKSVVLSKQKSDAIYYKLQTCAGLLRQLGADVVSAAEKYNKSVREYNRSIEETQNY